MTGPERSQKIGEAAEELYKQRERLDGLNTKAAGLAAALKQAADRLATRARGNLEPPGERGRPLECPDAEEAAEAFEGIADARQRIRAAEDRLKSLGVPLD